jgi:hypothetical protein
LQKSTPGKEEMKKKFIEDGFSNHTQRNQLTPLEMDSLADVKEQFDKFGEGT